MNINYPESCYVLLLNPTDNTILFLIREDSRGLDLPGGGVEEKDSDSKITAQRELAEETTTPNYKGFHPAKLE